MAGSEAGVRVLSLSGVSYIIDFSSHRMCVKYHGLVKMELDGIFGGWTLKNGSWVVCFALNVSLGMTMLSLGFLALFRGDCWTTSSGVWGLVDWGTPTCCLREIYSLRLPRFTYLRPNTLG